MELDDDLGLANVPAPVDSETTSVSRPPAGSQARFQRAAFGRTIIERRP